MDNPNTASATVVRVASNIKCRLGENPLWHPIHRKLYWCDIPLARLYCYDPETHITELLRDRDTAPGGAFLGGFTIQQDGALLLFMAAGRIDRWTPTTSETIVVAHKAHDGMRFNDVIADPTGRVFCGTVSLDGNLPGNLLRLDPDGTLTSVLDDVLCSNGLAFSRNGRHLYHTDSLRRTITRFDYDLATGNISNSRPWITTSEQDGLPDGITVDADDHIWTAQWGGRCVIRYSPDGREQFRIPLPVGRVSSITFGSNHLRTLFITTAAEEPSAQHPLDGSLFIAHPATRGIPEFPSRISISDRPTGSTPDA